MLTISGNDGNMFSDAMTDCGGLGTGCSIGIDAFMSKYKALIDSAQTGLQVTLSDIHSMAPNAKIILAGYPEPLSRTYECDDAATFSRDEISAMADLTSYMETKQSASVTALRTGSGIPVYYGSPITAFVGHGACDLDPWINAVVLGPNGDGDFHSGDANSHCLSVAGITGPCLSRESFHPNEAGTTGYATFMQDQLSAIGYTES